MRALAPLLLAFAALASAAGAACAQNPEKFERVVPPKAQPAAPAANYPPLVREVMRKGLAKESASGFCATMPANAGLGEQFYARPAGTAEQFREFSRFIGADICGYRRIAAVFSEKGKRCVHQDIWACYANKDCFAERQTFCDNGTGSYGIVRHTPLR